MRKELIIVVAAALTACCGGKKSVENGVFEQIDSVCQTYFPEEEGEIVPGAEVLIMKGDEVIFEKGYGRGIDGDAFFNIASCSKQFIAVAVLQLAEQGKIDIHAPIRQYFPELTHPIWDSITAAHLLSHSSGIPDERGYLTREQKVAGDEQLALEYIWTLDHLHFRPGTDYEYINPTFVLLGELVARVSGQPFVEYVQEHIFLPAGMTHTCYFDRDHQDAIPHMMHGYEYTNTDDMPEERTATKEAISTPKDWFEYDFGEETFFATRPDGGIYSSAHELVRWEQALRRNSSVENGDILAKHWLEEAWTPRTQVSGSTWSDYQNRPGTWYGYGYFIEPDKGCIYHTGDNGGFKILLARYPEKAVFIVILANRADWDRNELKEKLEAIVL